VEVWLASHYEKTGMELGLVPSYSPEYVVAYHGVDGIPLDLDGVARDTAKLHAVA